ncbi:MAG TPA: OsmC family protein [Anaerolineales bacterium]|jgi:putative redox protein|nr:OsmC family protein [Anaerolineales bacterium]
MPTETVHADWIDDQRFLLRDRFDFPIVMTQPNGVSGSDLLPLSLIGCAAWDVIAILRKQRQQVTGLQVAAESERDDEPPWRFRRIHITYRLTGRRLDPKRVWRAIELTEKNYCSIFATLSRAVEILSEFEILESPEGD